MAKEQNWWDTAADETPGRRIRRRREEKRQTLSDIALRGELARQQEEEARRKEATEKALLELRRGPLGTAIEKALPASVRGRIGVAENPVPVDPFYEKPLMSNDEWLALPRERQMEIFAENEGERWQLERRQAEQRRPTKFSPERARNYAIESVMDSIGGLQQDAKEATRVPWEDMLKKDPNLVMRNREAPTGIRKEAAAEHAYRFRTDPAYRKRTWGTAKELLNPSEVPYTPPKNLREAIGKVYSGITSERSQPAVPWVSRPTFGTEDDVQRELRSETLTKPVPFVARIYTGKEREDQHEIAQRIANDTATNEDYWRHGHYEARMRIAHEKGYLGKGADFALDMTAYMTEFGIGWSLLGGKVAQASKAGFAKIFAAKAPSKVGQTAVNFSSSLVGSFGSALMNPHQVWATMQEQLPGLGLSRDEEDRLIAYMGKDARTAGRKFLDAAVQTYFEHAIERWGGRGLIAVPKQGIRGLGFLAKKIAGDSVKRAGKAATHNAGLLVIKKGLTGPSGRSWAGRALRKAGFHGFGAEMAEEGAQGWANQYINPEHFLTTNQANVWTKTRDFVTGVKDERGNPKVTAKEVGDELIPMALAFLVVGAGGRMMTPEFWQRGDFPEPNELALEPEGPWKDLLLKEGKEKSDTMVEALEQILVNSVEEGSTQDVVESVAAIVALAKQEQVAPSDQNISRSTFEAIKLPGSNLTLYDMLKKQQDRKGFLEGVLERGDRLGSILEAAAEPMYDRAQAVAGRPVHTVGMPASAVGPDGQPLAALGEEGLGPIPAEAQAEAGVPTMSSLPAAVLGPEGEALVDPRAIGQAPEAPVETPEAEPQPPSVPEMPLEEQRVAGARVGDLLEGVLEEEVGEVGPNESTVSMLREAAEEAYQAEKDKNPRRASMRRNALNRAADAVEGLGQDIREVEDLQSIAGIGKGSAERIRKHLSELEPLPPVEEAAAPEAAAPVPEKKEGAAAIYQYLELHDISENPTDAELLGLEKGEELDVDIITEKHEAIHKEVDTLKLGPRAKESQELLNRLSRARLNLIDAALKAVPEGKLSPDMVSRRFVSRDRVDRLSDSAVRAVARDAGIAGWESKKVGVLRDAIYDFARKGLAERKAAREAAPAAEVTPAAPGKGAAALVDPAPVTVIPRSGVPIPNVVVPSELQVVVAMVGLFNETFRSNAQAGPITDFYQSSTPGAVRFGDARWVKNLQTGFPGNPAAKKAFDAIWGSPEDFFKDYHDALETLRGMELGTRESRKTEDHEKLKSALMAAAESSNEGLMTVSDAERTGGYQNLQAMEAPLRHKEFKDAYEKAIAKVTPAAPQAAVERGDKKVEEPTAAEGVPTRVYHASPQKIEGPLRPAPGRMNREPTGIFFAHTPEEAVRSTPHVPTTKESLDKNVTEWEVNAENPLDMHSAEFEDIWREVEKDAEAALRRKVGKDAEIDTLLKELDGIAVVAESLGEARLVPDMLTEALLDKGYDALVTAESKTVAGWTIALDPAIVTRVGGDKIGPKKGDKIVPAAPQAAVPEKGDRLSPYAFQDNNQEEVVHGGPRSDLGKWEGPGGGWRLVFEGTGDIFRELAQGGYTDAGYMGEKLARLIRYIRNEPAAHPDDTFETMLKHNQKRVDRLIELWEIQPAPFEPLRHAKEANLAILRQDYKGALESVKKAFLSANSRRLFLRGEKDPSVDKYVYEIDVALHELDPSLGKPVVPKIVAEAEAEKAKEAKEIEDRPRKYIDPELEKILGEKVEEPISDPLLDLLDKAKPTLKLTKLEKEILDDRLNQADAIYDAIEAEEKGWTLDEVREVAEEFLAGNYAAALESELGREVLVDAHESSPYVGAAKDVTADSGFGTAEEMAEHGLISPQKYRAIKRADDKLGEKLEGFLGKPSPAAPQAAVEEIATEERKDSGPSLVKSGEQLPPGSTDSKSTVEEGPTLEEKQEQKKSYEERYNEALEENPHESVFIGEKKPTIAQMVNSIADWYRPELTGKERAAWRKQVRDYVDESHDILNHRYNLLHGVIPNEELGGLDWKRARAEARRLRDKGRKRVKDDMGNWVIKDADYSLLGLDEFAQAIRDNDSLRAWVGEVVGDTSNEESAAYELLTTDIPQVPRASVEIEEAVMELMEREGFVPSWMPEEPESMNRFEVGFLGNRVVAGIPNAEGLEEGETVPPVVHGKVVEETESSVWVETAEGAQYEIDRSNLQTFFGESGEELYFHGEDLGLFSFTPVGAIAIPAYMAVKQLGQWVRNTIGDVKSDYFLDKLKDLAKVGGLYEREMWQELQDAEAYVRRVTQEVQYRLADLDVALKQSPWKKNLPLFRENRPTDSLTGKQLRLLNEALEVRPEKLAAWAKKNGLPDRLVGPVMAINKLNVELSKSVAEQLPEIMKDPDFVKNYDYKDLVRTWVSNKSVHLVRVYRAFDDPGWGARIKREHPELVERFRRGIAGSLREEAIEKESDRLYKEGRKVLMKDPAYRSLLARLNALKKKKQGQQKLLFESDAEKDLMSSLTEMLEPLRAASKKEATKTVDRRIKDGEILTKEGLDGWVEAYLSPNRVEPRVKKALGQTDMRILMSRKLGDKEFHEVVKKVLGEYKTSPAMRVLRSAELLSSFIANRKVQRRLAEEGLQKGWFKEGPKGELEALTPDLKVGDKLYDKTIPNNITYGALAGLRTTKAFYEALERHFGREGAVEGNAALLYRYWMGGVAIAKANKTIMNWSTQSMNTITNKMISIVHGDIPMKNIVNPFKWPAQAYSMWEAFGESWRTAKTTEPYLLSRARGKLERATTPEEKKKWEKVVSERSLAFEEKYRKTALDRIERGVYFDSPIRELEDMVKEAMGSDASIYTHSADAFDSDLGAFRKGKKLIKRGVSSYWKAHANLYRMGDDYWKGLADTTTIKMLERAYPPDDPRWKGKTSEQRREEIMKEAGLRVRDRYPTSSMSPEAIQLLRRFPIVATFPTWISEFARTQYWEMFRKDGWMSKDFRSGNPVLRSHAMATYARWGLAHYGASQAIGFLIETLMSLAPGGGPEPIKDEKLIEDLTEGAPPWDRYKSLQWFKVRGKDGKPKYYYNNLSRINPYGRIRDALKVYTSPEEGFDKIWVGADILLGELISQDMVLGRILAALSGVGGERPEGGDVYNPESPRATAQWMSYIWQVFKPGEWESLRRLGGVSPWKVPHLFGPAGDYFRGWGEADKAGREYNTAVEFLALITPRIGHLKDPKLSFDIRVSQVSERLARIRSDLWKSGTNKGWNAEKMFEDSLVHANKRWNLHLQSVGRLVRFGLATGLSTKEMTEAVQKKLRLNMKEAKTIVRQATRNEVIRVPYRISGTLEDALGPAQRKKYNSDSWRAKKLPFEPRIRGLLSK